MMKRFRGLTSFLLVAVLLMSTVFNGSKVLAADNAVTQNKKMIAAAGSRIAVLNDDGTVMIGGVYGEAAYKAREWTNIASIYVSYGTVYGITNDGKVKYTGTSETKQKLDSWTNVVSLAFCGSDIMGLRSDGTVYNTYEYAGMGNWKNIVSIAPGLGLKSNGTIEINKDSYMTRTYESDIRSWTDITKIVAFDVYGNGAIGLKKDGTLVYSGGYFNNSAKLREIENWKDIVDIYTVGSYRIVGLKKDGSVVIVGKGYTEGTLKTPIDLSRFTDMKSIAASDKFLIGIKNDGSIIGACGDNIDEFIKSIE